MTSEFYEKVYFTKNIQKEHEFTFTQGDTQSRGLEIEVLEGKRKVGLANYELAGYFLDVKQVPYEIEAEKKEDVFYLEFPKGLFDHARTVEGELILKNATGFHLAMNPVKIDLKESIRFKGENQEVKLDWTVDDVRKVKVNEAKNADRVNGFKLEQDVLANAELTDTKYDDEINELERKKLNRTALIPIQEDLGKKLEIVEGLQTDLISGAVDTGVLQTNINTKLEQLEEEYTPKLTEVTAQLAHIANNVVAYGVKSNGTDQSSIIQQIIDSGVDELYFPDGTYDVENLIIKHPLTIRGQSKENTVLRLKSDSNLGLLTNVGRIEGFKAINITFDDNGVFNGRKIGVNNIIKFTDVFPITFENCVIKDIVYGMWFDVTDVNVGTDIKHGVTFRDCLFYYDRISFGSHYDLAAININTAMNDGLIERCTFEDLSGNGIRVYPYGISPNQVPPCRWTFKDNKIINIQRYDPGVNDGEVYTGSAIYYRGDDLTLDNNKIINIKRQPLDVQGINSQQTSAKNIKILNNQFQNDDGFSDYRHTAMCLFRNAEVQFINNTVLCDKDTRIAKGVELKWGGSLIATGNKIFNSFRDGIDIWASDDAELPNTIDFVIITDNVINISGNRRTFSAVRVALSKGKHYNSITINNNTVNGNVLRIYKGFEGSGDIRNLVGLGNTSTSDGTFLLTEGDIAYCWKYNIVGMAEHLTNVIIKTNGLKFDGDLEVFSGTMKLPLNSALPTANSANSRKVMIIEVNGEHQMYICLKNASGIHTWKRLDV